MSKTEDWDELIESIKSLPVEEERTPMVRLWESEYERDLARPDMKLNENTIESISLLDVEKTANDEAGPLELEEMFQFQDPGFFAIREREISSELEKYLERCVMKYRDYSEGDIQLIKEMLISLFVLESVFLKNAQKENRHLGVFGRDLDDENDVVWKWRINTASDISKKPHEYLERLTICVDIKQRFPTIYNCILNKDFQAFSFLWEFLSREATYYRSIEVEDIIEDHDYKEVCRIIECKRLAELIQASDTSSFIEKCKDFIQNWKPKDIVAFLNQNIIAQENAKKRTAAMALYSHVVRIIHPEIESKKRNYLFLGPTGTGKTEIFRQLARISPVEINIMDASSITSEGFLGLSKGDMLKTLKQRSKDGQFEYSVIVMDECDKLIRPEYNSEGENINESIQGDLLKMVEGGEIFTGNFSNGDIIDTENIMFIFTGAFVGLVNENEEKNVCGFLGEAVPQMESGIL